MEMISSISLLDRGFRVTSMWLGGRGMGVCDRSKMITKGEAYMSRYLMNSLSEEKIPGSGASIQKYLSSDHQDGDLGQGR